MNASLPATTAYQYSGQMGRILLLGLEEILGRSGTNALLNAARLDGYTGDTLPDASQCAFTFEEISQIHLALESHYGLQCGRGLALRAGRASAKHGLFALEPVTSATDLAFRLLPLHKKLRGSLTALAEAFNGLTDQKVRLEEQPDHFLWTIERCPFCWGRRTESPACHLAVGILQEALYNVSGGRTFMVEETLCIAAGDSTCAIQIDKRPLD